MADEAAAAEALSKPKIEPKCPHCGAKPMAVQMLEFLIAPALVCGAFCCANVECGAVLSVQAMRTLRPDKSPIVVPGRANAGIKLVS